MHDDGVSLEVMPELLGHNDESKTCFSNDEYRVSPTCKI